MVLNKFWSGLVLGLVIAGMAGMARAGEKSVKILMPWDGEGSVYTIGTDKLLFMGEFEGIMYVETSAGDMDAAYANCPASQHIDVSGKQSSAEGYCTITISSEEVVFAEWNCKGKVGACEGTFKLTGGTGKYAGVTGSSDMLVRSVLNTLVVGMGNGDAVRAATGLAILPNLTYKLAK
jgi:hypothetical protein